MRGDDPTTTAKRAAQHETLMPLLKAMASDFQDLAKKKPDGALTKGKVAIVNRLLHDLRSLLEDEPSAAYLDLLDEEGLPQNSDVVLILGQFVAAMGSFRRRYHDGDGWRTRR
jgi:hypothetical protein